MHKTRQFTRPERIANGEMHGQAELLERMILQIAPGRERSLALTKLDEALMWASAAIAEGGITPKNVGATKHRAELEAAEKCACECPCGKEVEPDKKMPIKDDNDRDLEKAVDALLEKMDRCGFMSTLPTDDYRKLVAFEDELRELEETYGNACNSVNAKLALCRSILRDAADKARRGWDPKLETSAQNAKSVAKACYDGDRNAELAATAVRDAARPGCETVHEDGAKVARNIALVPDDIACGNSIWTVGSPAEKHTADLELHPDRALESVPIGDGAEPLNSKDLYETVKRAIAHDFREIVHNRIMNL